MSIKTWLINFLEGTNKNKNTIESIFANQESTIYYKELAIQTAINLIANGIAKCEIKTFENGEEIKGQNYYELNYQPNKNENSSQLWHKAIEKMIYEGECIIVNINGELFVADSYVVDEYPIRGNVYSGVVIDTLQLDKKFRYNEVIRLKLSNVDIKRLVDGLSSDYEELLSLAVKRYKASNQQKFVLELDSVKANDTEFNKIFKDTIQKQLKDFMENDKAVYPQFKGYNLRDVSNGNGSKGVDSKDFRDIRRDIFEVTAQAFQIPLDLMFGDVNNIEEVVKVFLTFCISPIADMISEELTRKIYQGYDNWSKGNYVRVDTSSIKHVDVLDMAVSVDKLIASGVCCVDEVREIIGMNPLGTEFSETHFITKNYDTSDNMLLGEPTEDDNNDNNKDTDTSTTDTGDKEIAQVSLNGAQISAVLEIVNAVINNQLEYESAVTLLTEAFPFDEETARRILGNPSLLTSDEELEENSRSKSSKLRVFERIIED